MDQIVFEISIQTRSLRYSRFSIAVIKHYIVVGQRYNNFHFGINNSRDTPRRKLVSLLINSFGRTMNTSLYFITFSFLYACANALDIRVRSLQKKGEGSYSSKSNSIRQSVSKEGNWPCIRLKYYPIRGRWKNREKSLPKRGRINLEAATRRIHTLIDETNPRNFRLCYSHVKDRS